MSSSRPPIADPCRTAPTLRAGRFRRAVLLAPLLIAFGAPAGDLADARATSGASLADVRSASSSAVPSGARSALALAVRAGREVQTAAFTPTGEYVVVAANQPLYSPGFPSAVRDHIDRYAQSGRQIDVVAFSRTGQWLAIAEDWLRHSNIPNAAAQRIRSLQGQGRRITSFAFHPTDANSWVLTAGGRAYYGGSMPTGLPGALAAAAAAGRDVHEVAISPTGQWVLVAESWFASRGLPSDIRQTLEAWRTDDRRRIDHVVFNRAGTTIGWSVISNGTEPVGTERMSRIENGLTSVNSTIYQRMKARRITGLSLALVDGSRVTRRSYGLRQAGRPESYVYPNSIFEAASISKPVSAVGALQLAEAGTVGLHDTKVLGEVAKKVLLPVHVSFPGLFLAQFEEPGEIDLNRLLSHCAGALYQSQLNNLTATGAESFALSATQATLAQSLLGRSPASANKKPVQSSSVRAPGQRFTYSGATYLLVQAVIEAHAQGGYDGHMTRLLRDLGMTSSTFVTPAPTRVTDRFARGHRAGTMTSVESYPAKAAASLSTTADDLARFIVMLDSGGRAATGKQVLSSGHVRALAGLQRGANERCSNRGAGAWGTMGLGLYRTNAGTWFHRGRHNGYLAYVFARPGSSPWGLAVLMTGAEGNNGDALGFARELLDSVEAAFGMAAGTLPN